MEGIFGVTMLLNARCIDDVVILWPTRCSVTSRQGSAGQLLADLRGSAGGAGEDRGCGRGSRGLCKVRTLVVNSILSKYCNYYMD